MRQVSVYIKMDDMRAWEQGLRPLNGESANVTANALIMSEMHVTVKVTFRMPIGGKALTVLAKALTVFRPTEAHQRAEKPA